MDNNIPKYLQTHLTLLKRDLILLRKTFLSKVIDGLFSSLVIIITTGILLPAIGLPSQMVAPLYLGSLMNLFFMFGYCVSINMVYDVKFKGRVYYLSTLPLPKSWLFAEYILYTIIELTVIILPLIGLGTLLLADHFAHIQTNWPLFGLIYFLSTLFVALFMFAVAFHYPEKWFIDNIWPRRLSPLFCFGAVMFVWKEAYAFTPVLATTLLINPVVYITEGIRHSFIGGDAFLPAWVCISGLIAACILTAYWLSKSIIKRLDPVC